MNLEEFCRAREIDLPSVAASVSAGVGLRPNDGLLAVGSLVEGIGNSKSDLDLLLITARPEAELPAQDEVALIVGRCVVDVRILRSSWVEELLERLRLWSSLPWDATHAAGFGIEERTLLHRLCHGHLLWPERERSETLAPRREDVARLKIHTARHVARSIQVDLDGYVEEDAYDALVFAAQDLLGHAVDALLAGYGLTNPLPKWRTKLLGSMPADWEASLPGRPSGLDAADRIWRLHRAPDRPAKDECVEHALRISSVARAIFVWADRQLRSQAAIRDRRLLWPGGEQGESATAAFPHLDFDVDFLLADDRVTVGRLNSFGNTLTLSVEEFEIALLCNGVTTLAEAEAVVAAGEEGTLAADDIVARLAAAGMIRVR